MIDDEKSSRWLLEKLVAHERELGRSEARHTASEQSIARIAQELKDGFARLEQAHSLGFNHLRGEMKAAAEAAERQRKTDMQTISDSIDESRRSGDQFRAALTRVAWTIIAAIVAVAAGQIALTEPRAVGVAARVAQQSAQTLTGQ